MLEERAQRLRHREHELPVRQLKKYLVGEMLGEEKCTLLATRWAQVEAFAAKRPEVVMPAAWVCAPDSILVLITELVEVSIKDLMEFIPAARNIPRAGYLPNRD